MARPSLHASRGADAALNGSPPRSYWRLGYARLAQWLPLSFGAPNVIASALLFAYFIAHARKEGCGAPQLNAAGLLTYAYSFFTLNLLVQVHGLLLRGWPRVRAATGILFSVVLVLLLGYHFARLVPLDYDTIQLNAANGLGDGVLEVVVDSLGTNTLIVAGLVALAMGVLEWRVSLLASSVQVGPSARKAAVVGGLWLATVAGSFDTRDPITYFVRTWRDSVTAGGSEPIAAGQYPYVVVSAQRPPRTEPLPTVFLVMMESFNARYVGEHNEAGTAITPVFDSLIRQGLYFDWFYGNSIQTSKGHATTLLSVLPSARRKILVNYSTNSFQSVAKVLKDRGYGTLFFQAYANTAYEHGDEFYLRNGFDRVLSAAATHGEPKPGEAWGWGLRDEVFYTELFRELDQTKAERPEQPIFVMAAPISNHAPFDKVPPDLRAIYPDPQDRHEHYSNSIHLSDAALTVFLAELAKRPQFKDSLVIITGDHSFPTGEHGYTNNVSSFYEEFFRTPMLLLWPGHIEPHRISDVPRSQIDIAPTIVDLLGFSEVKHHFLGHSLLDAEAPRPIFLVQPYSGRYLGVVVAPYKFVVHERTGEEFLFNLQLDPKEQQNLVGDADQQSRVGEMRPLLKQIAINEQLLVQDQIWPRSN